jgi:hypothetical protein
LIFTLLITVIVEGVVALGYCVWRSKPLLPVLVTSVVANIITQSMLWMILNLFFQQYLIALLISELVIWLLESIALYLPPRNQLLLKDALLLSLGMNFVSFGIGWFLPI